MPRIKLSINNNYSNLDVFLKKHKASVPNGTYTHTSIANPRGSYFIEEKEREEFFEKYYKHVFEEKLSAHLTEGIKDCQITPVKIDLDFRSWQSIDDGEPERLYQMEDIVKICQRYMVSMEQWLVNPDPCERECFILEKPKASFDKKNGVIKTNDRGEKRIKDGVHIMFPYICTKTFLQLQFREFVFKNCDDILGKYKYDNSYADIFDRAVIDRNNWQMYGSSKGKDAYAYKVTKILEIYTDKTNEINLKKYTDMELVKLLSVRNKDLESLIKYEMKSTMEELEEKQEAIRKRKKLYSTKGKPKKAKLPKDELRLIRGTYDKDGNKIKPGYIDCLSIERAKSYDTWMEVGWALHNIDNVTGIHSSKTGGRCVLLTEWINWSRQLGTGYEDGDEDTYEKEWNEMRNYGLGIGSLKIWAREDSKKAHDKLVEKGKIKESEHTLYEKVVGNDLYNWLMQACNGKKGGTSYDVAKVMYQMYKDDFKCISIKDTLWYYYDTNLHRWIEDDKGVELRKKISTEVWKKFNNLGLQFGSKVQVPGDDWEVKRDQVYKTASRLKETSFKKNLMVECAELFHDKSRKFYNELDSNLNLLGFNNGIFDLVNEEFRNGRPEDLISMSTNIDYIAYDKNSKEVKEINKFLTEILTNKNVRDYVIHLMGTFLSGSTKNEKFHVWSGSGGNGKSKLIELLERAIGDYAGKMNISNLTSKRAGGGSANPEMARTKGKRFVNLQEPDEHCKLNVGLMKELTGGDKIIARALYKEPVEFKPQFKMVLTCNDKPELPPDDEGTWRRIVLVEYRSKFRHEPKGNYNDYKVWIPDSNENPEFPIDESLNERFEEWAEPFMSILINSFIVNKNKDLREPKEVQEYTNKYREQNDHFREFINDKIIHDPESDNVIKISTLYIEYKEWYKDNHGSTHGQKKLKELKAFMDKEFGEYRGDKGRSYSAVGYKGLTLINSDEYLQTPANMEFIEDGDELDS